MGANSKPAVSPAPDLSSLSEAERARALERFRLLRPFLEEEVSLPEIARIAGISLRTARYWVRRYREEGFAGLARKTRRDKKQPKIAAQLLQPGPPHLNSQCFWLFSKILSYDHI